MLIRKNTKAFKTIRKIITDCKDRPDRVKLVRLYVTKAGHSIKDRINVEGIQGDAALFYDINYDAVWNNLASADRQLYQSDDIPGIYFFNTSANKAWDETPFEFDESVAKEFASLSDLPVVRRKGKVEEFALPVSRAKTEPEKKLRGKPKAVAPTPVRPNYKTKHKFEFTDLDKNVFSSALVTKKDLLDYYSNAADTMLSYLIDRPIEIRLLSKGREKSVSTLAELIKNDDSPEWIRSNSLLRSKGQHDILLCPDRDHVLWYAEAGAIAFASGHARLSSPDFADYSILVIEASDEDIGKTIKAALLVKQILTGLQLPSHVKTDGRSALHVYFPLDARTKFETGKALAGYIAKLVRLKAPDLIALDDSDANSYGKVLMNYQLNSPDQKTVVPYSFVAGDTPSVAMPISWDAVQVGLQFKDYNSGMIGKIIRKEKQPPGAVPNKTINATAVLKRLEGVYSFLFS